MLRDPQVVCKESGGGEGGKWWHNITTDSGQTSLQVNDRLQYSDTDDVRATTVGSVEVAEKTMSEMHYSLRKSENYPTRLYQEPFVTVQFVVLVPASSPFHPHASIYAKCISWSSRRIIDVPSSVKNVPSSFRSNRAPQSSSSVNKSRRGVRGVPVCVVIVLHQAARAGQGGSTRPVERESTAKRHHRCVSTCNVDGTVGRGGGYYITDGCPSWRAPGPAETRRTSIGFRLAERLLVGDSVSDDAPAEVVATANATPSSLLTVVKRRSASAPGRQCRATTPHAAPEKVAAATVDVYLTWRSALAGINFGELLVLEAAFSMLECSRSPRVLLLIDTWSCARRW
ncbi:hypothetical protein MTP99_008964 [Tenebrio molitor]|nr:hypothetical protein MTP99_008964 [Tenebrio molitor]